MLSVKSALEKLLSNFEGSELVDYVVYKNLLVAQILFGDDNERGFDPFFSIDLNTEEILDYPILLDSSEPVLDLFLQKQNKNN